MNIATLTDGVAATSTDVASTLDTINSNIELFILLFVMFECIKFVRYGFNKLYKKGV